MAVAHEQEMKAAVQEMRAKVVEAEAEVPKAMAAALREGKLGVMDYYQMQNTIADTSCAIPLPRRVRRRARPRIALGEEVSRLLDRRRGSNVQYTFLFRL